MAHFLQVEVTTVIWMQGFETNHTKSAANIGYRPEWVIAGDDFHEGWQTGQSQEQSVWHDHAWVVTPVARSGNVSATYCYQALKEADPNVPPQDASFECGLSTTYQDLRLLVTSIQVAGPRLGPSSIDKGLHAIPPILSTDPEVPSCFFEPGDYTCVKDAQWKWWDREGAPPGSNNRPGCWRMVLGGRRFIAGRWPGGDVAAQRRRGSDVCNNYAGDFLIIA
jgi:hypothetical protein